MNVCELHAKLGFIATLRKLDFINSIEYYGIIWFLEEGK